MGLRYASDVANGGNISLLCFIFIIGIHNIFGKNTLDFFIHTVIFMKILVIPKLMPLIFYIAKVFRNTSKKEIIFLQNRDIL